MNALEQAILCNNLNQMRLLLNFTFDVNKRLVNGKNLLHLAIEKKAEINTIKVLIENGADVNAKDDNGKTPLISAALLNAIDVVDLLIKNGADVNPIERNRRTFMKLASGFFKQQISDKLLNHGADPYLLQIPKDCNFQKDFQHLSIKKWRSILLSIIQICYHESA